MPEIKRIFTSGRMNKDLDERLVPNGEYRDAENLQLSTSEGSDVGALQNILGTTLKKKKSYNSTTQISTYHPSNFGYDTLKAIGSTVDTQNNKIYWFIVASKTVEVDDEDVTTNYSAIAEFDKATGVIAPVLVDSAGILNFSDSYKITGINVIDGLLLWTDYQTEPKQLNIQTFKDGGNITNPFITHTLYNGVPFVENDITVIKKSPLSAPTFEKYLGKFPISKRGGITESTTTFNFYDFSTQKLNNLLVGSNYLAINTDLDVEKGDTLELSHTYDDSGTSIDLKIRFLVTAITKINVTSGNTEIRLSGRVITKDTRINNTIADEKVVWIIKLIEDDGFFEYKIPRFAYRWKYDNGQYSCYSPFSEPAFQPGDFEYKSDNGYNIGMVNNVKRLKLTLPDTPTDDIDEIDILYKESNNNLVYVVDTLKRDTNYNTLPSTFEITSEVYGSVVESNQLLRPWDNVPKKAKAQDITANRIVYGNYIQNYDIPKENKPVIDAHIESEEITAVKTPEKSLKSLRTYQIGVTYKDIYGRETPVFTTKKASNFLNVEYASKVNSITTSVTNQAPNWATHFKYYIKETSNEYYNLALDRFYPAEDGNVWLSFPSSERNKIQIEDFLILKKQHDSDVAVAEKNKFKILDIQNEVPEFIATKWNATARLEVKTKTDGSRPGSNKISFKFRGPSHVKNPKFAEAFDSEAAVVIELSDQTQTQMYEVQSGSVTSVINPADSEDESDIVYEIKLDKPIKETFLDTDLDNDESFYITVFNKEKKIDKEFSGRFFAKIPRTVVFKRNIEEPFAGTIADFVNATEKRIYPYCWNFSLNSQEDPADVFIDGQEHHHGGGIGPKPNDGYLDNFGWSDMFSWVNVGRSQTTFKLKNNDNNTEKRNEYAPKISKDAMKIIMAGYAGGSDSPITPGKYTDEFLEKISQKGCVIRFGCEDFDTKDITMGDNLYEILESTVPDYERRGWCTYNVVNPQPRKRDWNARMIYSLKFKNIGSYGNVSIDPSNVDAQLAATYLDVGGDYQETFVDVGETAKPPTHIFIQERLPNQTNETLSSNNPAIFETEPKEDVDLDIYHEISDAYPIAEHGDEQILDWFNCYSFGNGVESDRIRDDYNQVRIDKGPRVSTVMAEQYKEEQRKNGLIWSGIFNSKAGINRLNQFIMAEKITKDINPYYGSIQKLHSRNTDLITFCEDKIIKILANKDALYNADGNTNLTATENVLGQAIPYIGEYGISDQPESFASHAFRVYFSDRSRGAVLRLSRDGLTNIATKGMTDYFNDNLPSSLLMLGSYDESKQSYNLTHTSTTKDKDVTVSFDERVNGWTSFKSFDPECAESLDNIYYSIKTGNLWSHTNTKRNRFYDTTSNENDTTKYYNSSINVFLNEEPSVVKNFKTLNYEGSKSRIYTYNDTDATATTNTKGWFCELVTTNLQTGGVKEFVDKEGKWFNYIKGESTSWSNDANSGNVDPNEFSVQGLGQVTACDGDTVPTKRTVTVTVNNNTTSSNVTIGSGTTFTASPNGVISKTISGGTAIIVTLTPKNGYVIKADDFDYVNETSAPMTDAIPVTDGQDNDSGGNSIFHNTGIADTVGNTVQVRIPLSFNIHPSSASNQTVVCNITGSASEFEYKVDGKYHIESISCTPASIANQPYTVSSTNGVEAEIPALDKEFVANSNYHFEDLPTVRITQANTSAGTYRVVTTTVNAIDNYVVGGLQKKVRFRIYYTPVDINGVNDEVHFFAKAVSDTTFDTPLITAYYLNRRRIGASGDVSRAMTIYGTENAQYRLNVKSSSAHVSDPTPYNYYFDHVTDGTLVSFSTESTTTGTSPFHDTTAITNSDQMSVYVSSEDNGTKDVPKGTWVKQVPGTYNVVKPSTTVSMIEFTNPPVANRTVRIVQHTEWLRGTGGLNSDTYLSMPSSGSVTIPFEINSLESKNEGGLVTDTNALFTSITTNTSDGNNAVIPDVKFTTMGKALLTAEHYGFNNALGNSYPGPRMFGFTSHTIADVATIAIDYQSGANGSNGVVLPSAPDRTSIYKQLQDGYIKVADNGSTTNYTLWKITAVEDKTGYYLFTVTDPVAGSDGHTTVVNIQYTAYDITLYPEGGIGGRLSLTIAGNKVTAATAISRGVGYKEGTTLTVSSDEIGGSTDVVITLKDDDIEVYSSQAKFHLFTLEGDLAPEFDTALGQVSNPYIEQGGNVGFTSGLRSTGGSFNAYLPTNSNITSDYQALGKPGNFDSAGVRDINWVVGPVPTSTSIVLDSNKIPSETLSTFTNTDSSTNGGMEFGIENLSTVLSNNDRTLTITATKDISQYGSLDVKSIMDLDYFASLYNQPPVFTDKVGSNHIACVYETAIIVTLAATDAGGDTLTYKIKKLPYNLNDGNAVDASEGYSLKNSAGADITTDTDTGGAGTIGGNGTQITLRPPNNHYGYGAGPVGSHGTLNGIDWNSMKAGGSAIEITVTDSSGASDVGYIEFRYTDVPSGTTPYWITSGPGAASSTAVGNYPLTSSPPPYINTPWSASTQKKVYGDRSDSGAGGTITFYNDPARTSVYAHGGSNLWKRWVQTRKTYSGNSANVGWCGVIGQVNASTGALVGSISEAAYGYPTPQCAAPDKDVV